MKTMIAILFFSLPIAASADPVYGGQQVGSPLACQWVCTTTVVQGVPFTNCRKVC